MNRILLALCSMAWWMVSIGQPQNTLLVDDFEQFPVNSFGAINPPPFADTLGTTVITRSVAWGDDAFGHAGQALQLSFELPDSGGFCGQLFPLPQLDLSPYGYLSFRVRSDQPNVFLQVELKRNNDTEGSKVAIGNFLPGGPVSDWSKVVIPLKNFWNLSSLTDMTGLVIGFEHFGATANGSPLTAGIVLDDIVLGTYPPGYIRLDPFDDLYGPNATGGNIGTFDPIVGSTNYTYAFDCSTYGLDPCGLRIDYTNNPGSFGGMFFILGGGVDGWTKVPQNLTGFASLHLKLKADNAATNPGNVKVELKSAATGTYSYRALGIPDTGFRAYNIPMSAFSPVVNVSSIDEFTIVFESGWQNVASGVLRVEEIELRSSTYQGPDLAAPSFSGPLTVNGQVPPAPIAIGAQDTLWMQAAVPHTETRVEQVWLEYTPYCEDAWTVLETWYAPLGNNLDISLPASALPPSGSYQLRLCVENYQGITTCSDAVDIAIEPDSAEVEGFFRDAYAVIEALRAPSGAYRDAIVLNGAQYHPASVATTGVGLVSLCIADSMGWDPLAEAKALHTLKAMAGLNAGFQPERNLHGLFRHFIDLVTGEQAWDSEFSSIDSGILTAAALFAKSYFRDNDSIGCLADALFLSTDWASCMANPTSGAIFLTQDYAGQGAGLTLPYNEYMIVAWLAKHDAWNPAPGTQLWDLHYADPQGLPTATYCGYDVLTDVPGQFLSNFIPQFCYYYCHPYTTSPAYQVFMEQAMLTDRCWWQTEGGASSCYIWGFGAGAAPDSVGGYHADNISFHPGDIASPHIIAGFIPLDPNALTDLLALRQSGLGLYQLPNSNVEFLWRYSLLDPTWVARDVQGIDFSTMVYGLAAHPRFLGPDFFPTHNQYAFPTAASACSWPLSYAGLDTLCGTPDTVNLAGLVTDLQAPASQHQWTLLDTTGVAVRLDTVQQVLFIDSLTEAPSLARIVLRLSTPQGGPVVDTVYFCATSSLHDPLSPFKGGYFFPNPTDRLLHFPLPPAPRHAMWVSVYSLQGERLLQDQVAVGEREPFGTIVLPAHLASGVYVIELRSPQVFIRDKVLFYSVP